MKKRNYINGNFKMILSMVTVMATSFGYSQSNNPAPYCASEFDVNYNMLNNIKIKGTQLDFGPMGSWGATNNYEYHNTFSFPVLEQGEAVSVELNVYSVNDLEPIYFGLWIDFNNNDVFENNELVMQNSNTIMGVLPTFGAPAPPINKTITIPNTAVTGITRARLIRATNEADPFAPYDATFTLSPCNTASMANLGNTYDFNIEITNENLSTDLEQSGQNIVSVYPNPVADNLQIQLRDSDEYEIKVKDLNGKTIKTVLFQGEHYNLNMESFSTGTYFIQIQGKDLETMVKKIIKK